MKIDIRQKPPTASPTHVVQDYFTAFGRGDIDGVLAVLSDDVVWHVDGTTSVSTVGLLRGRDRVKEWLIAFPANFIPRVFAIDRLFESGDQVIAIGRFRHTIASTGNTVGSDLAIRFTLRDGLIVRYQILEDSLLLAQAFEPNDAWSDKKIRINGTIYAYTDRGEGPSLVFTHGLFVDRTIFDAQVAILAKSHRCIVLDMPGHGASGYRAGGWTLDDLADDLALMIAELSLGPVIFVGQSQGGMIGMRLAASRRGLVSGLVLIGTNARAEYPERIETWRDLRKTLLDGDDGQREAAFAMVQKRLNAPEWLARESALAAEERRIMLGHDRNGVALALDAATLKRTDIRPLLKNITAPTLVICGDADRATPIELSQEMASAIAGSRLEVLAGVGHHAPLEAPAAVTAALSRFIDGVEQV